LWNPDLKQWIDEDTRRSDWYRRLEVQRRHADFSMAPAAWYYVAWALHKEAEHLWSCPSAPTRLDGIPHPDVRLMLSGMAVEAMLKAVIVVNDPAARIATGGHDLVKLCQRAEIRTNQADRDLLSRLSHYVRWAGRYPSTRSLEELLRFEQLPRRPLAAVEYGRLFNKLDRALVRTPYRLAYRRRRMARARVSAR